MPGSPPGAVVPEPPWLTGEDPLADGAGEAVAVTVTVACE
jgi:hypothetical protein